MSKFISWWFSTLIKCNFVPILTYFILVSFSTMILIHLRSNQRSSQSIFSLSSTDKKVPLIRVSVFVFVVALINDPSIVLVPFSSSFSKRRRSRFHIFKKISSRLSFLVSSNYHRRIYDPSNRFNTYLFSYFLCRPRRSRI